MIFIILQFNKIWRCEQHEKMDAVDAAAIHICAFLNVPAVRGGERHRFADVRL